MNSAVSSGSSKKASEFAKLFEESQKISPIKEGEITRGTVVHIGRDHVVVDIGYKSEGQVPIQEFKNYQGELTVKVGDTVDVFLESVEDDSGMMILSKERADAMRTWDRLVEASEKDEAIEGTVVGKVKGGLSVDIGVKAFLPGSQVDVRPVRNLDKFLGKPFKFKIIKLNKKRGNVVVSRKAVLEKERETLRTEVLQNLHEGQILEGVIKNITEYGVFVDLGGLDGLLHVTDMSWGRLGHPSELFEVGDDIRVKVLKYDDKSGRISLGYKQLQSDPWEDVEDRFAVGSRVNGKVTSLADYGAFIGLSDGVEGLVHISEMSWTKKIKHPSKILNVGDGIEAVVLDIDLTNRRISLGLKQIEENPWTTLAQKFPLGTKIQGEIKNIADFGLFVDVGADIDALVHISDLCWVQNFESPAETFKKGDKIEVIILHVDPENERFSAGVKQLLDDPWDIINKKYTLGKEAPGKVSQRTKLGLAIELEPGVEGLITEDEAEGLKVDDAVTVIVKEMDPSARRFVLTPKQ